MILLIIFNLCVDGYIWSILRRMAKKSRFTKGYLFSSLFLLVYAIVLVALPRRRGADPMIILDMWMLFTYFTAYVPKLVFILFGLVAQIPRLWHRRASRPTIWVGAGAAIVVFVAMWWGALINRLTCEVKEVELTFDNLPEAFDGYRIVQFSDFHVGTYDHDTTFVHEVVEQINALHPDAIFFTGDIVNRRTSELLPFVKPLSHLSAPDGVVSIMGNHDYGDYSEWKSPQAKADNLQQLHSLQADMGWQLLLNDTEWIHRGTDSIAVVGVENWGDPPFTVYGDLRKAYPAVSDSVFKILLTHNPAHWIAEVESCDSTNIALSLSGHTHAMQIVIAGWSPAKYRYKTWGGLYASSDDARKLYVNIGLGTVAFPMRVGATPEITVFTLRRTATSKS
jgi:hypothetical protein